MGEAFLSFPSLQGAAAQEAEGNSHPDKRTADISCGAAPPTAPSPGPGITWHRAPWARRRAPPGQERKTLSGGSRRQTPPAGVGAQSLPGSGRSSARGKLRLGLCRGRCAQAPGARAEVGWISGFTQRKEGETETRAGRAENLEHANPTPEVSIWGASLQRGSCIREGNPKKELAP